MKLSFDKRDAAFWGFKVWFGPSDRASSCRSRSLLKCLARRDCKCLWKHSTKASADTERAPRGQWQCDSAFSCAASRESVR
eukprot:5112868-Amphidinium_carterae.1